MKVLVFGGTQFLWFGAAQKPTPCQKSASRSPGGFVSGRRGIHSER
jgi:hypothetical protein